MKMLQDADSPGAEFHRTAERLMVKSLRAAALAFTCPNGRRRRLLPQGDLDAWVHTCRTLLSRRRDTPQPIEDARNWARREPDDAELIRCYQQCDLFVLPNREVDGDFEGFGMVLVEAQACGKPVVAGASGGTAETMQIPDTGLTVNCDTLRPLTGVLVELLQDHPRREAMGTAGRDWVVEQFDWDALAAFAETLFAIHTESSDHIHGLTAASGA